jgi:eukaryotic-like serine/threonine-protein kinase
MPETSKNHLKTKKFAAPRTQALSSGLDSTLPRRSVLIPNFTLKLGDRIGDDLTVIGHLNRGRNSELYQVWSVSFLCALTCKILLPGYAPNSREVRNFKREAMLLRRLKHPHIVRIFARGNFEGRDYLVQEFLHGPSLLDMLHHAQHHRLSVPDAIKGTIHVSSALDHLHAQGYIYQDLKPANILLRGGIPVLVDFDAAGRLKAGRTGRSLGTDPYMAPEQCLEKEVSVSADVYGVGAVFYELLTGEWPYEQELHQSREKKTLEERYPQISGNPPRAPHELNRDIPPDLSKIVLRCLEFDPARRFQTVRDFVKNLFPFLGGKDQMWPESLDLSCCSGE